VISAAEKREICIQDMGPELGAMYCDLNDHLLDIILLWKQYEQLFGADEATVRLLNGAAPLFFSVVQAQLWDSVMLGISRLTDPPLSAGKKTLSIRALPPLISDGGVRSKVEAAIHAAINAAEFARAHRNKRIAHNDLVHIMDRAANPLPAANRQSFKVCLNLICEVLELINGHYRESTMLYDDMIYNGGAGSLIYFLRTSEASKR
jgi:hypothetical protein